MKKSEITTHANGVLQSLRDQGLSDADARKVLSAAREAVKRPRAPHVDDSTICSHFVPGQVVRPRQLATQLGCTPDRVKRLLFASCPDVAQIVRGIYQIPA